MGGRKGHSFTQDLVTLSSTNFALSLSEYMPSHICKSVVGTRNPYLRFHAKHMDPPLPRWLRQVKMETSYMFKKITTFLSKAQCKGNLRKKHSSPVMTKISSWENFRVLLLSITSSPASGVLNFLSCSSSLRQ